MLKRPKIHFIYGYPDNSIPVEIVYYHSLGRYAVYVYTLHKYGKGVCFSSCDGPDNPFDKWFFDLEELDVKTRLKQLHKLVRKLEKIINNRGIPFKGTRKSKPNPKYSKL